MASESAGKQAAVGSGGAVGPNGEGGLRREPERGEFPAAGSPGTVSPGAVPPGTVQPGVVSPGAVSPDAAPADPAAPDAAAAEAVSPDTGALNVVDPTVRARVVTDAVARMRSAAEVFLVRLRRDGDFDPEALDELCEAIDRCGRRWRSADAIPKEAALILAELYPAIHGCAWQYGETDPMRRQIVDAATRVQESIGAGLDNPRGGLDREL